MAITNNTMELTYFTEEGGIYFTMATNDFIFKLLTNVLKLFDMFSSLLRIFRRKILLQIEIRHKGR